MTAPASQWRLALGRRVAPAYSGHPAVAAVGVGGSVARGWADRHSDVEVGVFWHRPPSDIERRDLIAGLGGEHPRVFPFDATREVGTDDYLLYGVKVDVVHAGVSLVERWIGDVLEGFDPDPDKQNLISALRHALPLYGAPLLEGWSARTAPYPDGLARAVVGRNVWLTPAAGRAVLAERGDVLPLYESICAVQRRVLLAIMGLNRVYLPHPGFKWLSRVATDLPVAPPDLAGRVAGVFRAEPRKGVSELHALVEETFDLIETWMPEVEVGPARAWFRSPRPIWDESPLKLA